MMIKKMSKEEILNQIMGVQEASAKWGVTPDRVKQFCEQGRFPCVKVGNNWILLKDQEKPTDPRKKA